MLLKEFIHGEEEGVEVEEEMRERRWRGERGGEGEEVEADDKPE